MSNRKSEYAKKLRDPRWQKKRLEIFTRDEWMCQHCFDAAATLHVHHLNYEFGKEPWDYDNRCLLTLCETCHEAESHDRKEAEKHLISLLRIGFMASAGDVQELANTLELRASQNGYSFSVNLSAIDYALRSRDFISEYFKFLETNRLSNCEVSK